MIFRLSASCLALLLATAAPALAADVGEVVLVRNDVRGTLQGGSPTPLAVGNGVGLGLRVDTGADSAARMTFDPSGSLTLGSRAKVVVDRNLVGHRALRLRPLRPRRPAPAGPGQAVPRRGLHRHAHRGRGRQGDRSAD
jgi:hypothetical protein